MKTEIKKNVKYCVITALMTLLITTLAFYYVYALTPSATLTITGGVYPGAPSYTIWKEGANYFAKDENGNIDYSGTDFSTVIQNSLDVLDTVGSGQIYIGVGDFSVSTTINVTMPYVEIWGANPGSTGTVLAMADNADCNMFNLNTTFCRLKNLRLEGNNAHNTQGIGVCADPTKGGDSSGDLILDSCFILDFDEEGIYWQDCWGSIIENSYIEYNGGYGAVIYSRQNMLTDSTFSFNGECGLRTRGGGTGIPIALTITGCAFIDNEKHGINITGVDQITITGCIFQGNGRAAANTYSGVFVYGGTQISITGNTFDGNGSRTAPLNTQYSKHGIRVESNVNVTIIGNVFRLHLSTPIYCAYSGKVIIYGNIGYVNLARDKTAAITTGTAITHGLVATPTTVIITAAETGPTDIYVSDVGGVSFKINFGGGGSKTFYWYAEYQP